MNAAPASDWKKDFGLTDRTAPTFFPSIASVEAAGTKAPQGYALRRAFEVLGLSGILCQNNAPVVYFKVVEHLVPDEVAVLHRRFWNQGLSPLLVLIAPAEVHVYSSLTEPPRVGEPPEARHRLVSRLRRAADAGELRQFALAVESGEVFRQNAKSFDPAKRVDRELLRNLTATRDQLAAVSAKSLDPRILDNLLCRVVFTSYLFDRGVIDPDYLRAAGISDAEDLRAIVSGPREPAVARLYTLFKRLGEDFNGDLFSDDLDAEAGVITERHLRVLARFLSGADVRTGQGSFWPYDFAVIPIETISAIYEHFLKAADPEEKKRKGAFYTPRFLAEMVLDMALDGVGRLLDKRFIDPACGSGIFLVGLFNRIAEEWNRDNEGASYSAHATALFGILKNNLFGVDENPTACQIAAFSLYLAVLDHLRPSQIQELQKRKKFLPKLVSSSDAAAGRTIFCGDYFTLPEQAEGQRFDVVLGNPPWASLSGPPTPAEEWCKARTLPTANRQIALAFVWKAAEQVAPGGRVCFVLPNGVLFNHQAKAIGFQRVWFGRHTVDVVLNLSDYQRFLFDKAEFPAVVVRYRAGAPDIQKHRVAYWSPKTDWSVSRAEVITIASEDRTEVKVGELLADLKTPTAPIPWKVMFWATPRDQKLIERLGLFPRLGAITRQTKEPEGKRWLAGQGFKPEKNDNRKPDSKPNPWDPGQLFLEANSKAINLLVVESDSSPLGGRFPWLHRLPAAREIFEPPHVLVTKGLRVAYCDYPVVFRHALQGIHGPQDDRPLLMFLAAYLTSPLARYFLFHTTSSWGVSRAEVHLEELLTVPFPLPNQTLDPKRGQQIIREVVAALAHATAQAGRVLANRSDVVSAARKQVTPLIYDYFDLDAAERSLVEDTNGVVIPSTRPKKASNKFPTLTEPSNRVQVEYVERLCDTLNGWANRGPYRIRGRALSSTWSGVGAVELQKVNGTLTKGASASEDRQLLDVLERLHRTYRKQLGSVELLRGVKVFDQNTLYLFKPLRLRFWTQTAALNDADSIAATILTSGDGGRA